MKQQFKVYFKTRSNYVDLLSEILNVICFCCYKSQNLWLRLLGIIPIALMWYRFVVVLRNADSASAFITMLFAIIIESVPFIGILFVFYAAFTSVFLVLSIQANYFNNNLDISNSIFGIKYIDVMFNVIQLSFGQFTPEHYDKKSKVIATLAWILFLIATFMLALILMNMLIALMGEVYGRKVQTI